MAIQLRYQYRPVQHDEIRIVHILHDIKSRDMIRCRISHHKLASAPKYDAVSYAWGDPNDLAPILCSDENYLDADLVVTRSLHHLIRSRRSRIFDRAFWIDQICIDQHNITERNQQVQLMNDIYTRAHLVLVWLGPRSEDDKLIKKAIQHLAPRGFAQSGWTAHPIAFMFSLKLKDSEWQAVARFFDRLWFSRTWILQETRPWKTVFCIGDWCCMQFFIIMAISVLSSYSLIGTRWFPERPAAVSWLAIRKQITQIGSRNDVARGPRGKILEILAYSSLQQASDDRDKLFGVLGLCEEIDRLHLVPDYRLDVIAVYRNLVIHCLEQHRSTRFLTYTGGARYGMPGWVPDWATSRKAESLSWLEAATSADPIWSISAQNDTLTLKGYYIGPPDQIIATPVMSRYEIEGPVDVLTSWLREIRLLSKKAFLSSVQVPQNASRLQLKASSLEKLIDGDPSSRWEAFYASLKLGKDLSFKEEPCIKIYNKTPLDLLYIACETPWMLNHEHMWRVVRECGKEVLNRIEDLHFCMVDNGKRFGWVTNQIDATKGDFVVLFPGSSEFTVLRPKTQEGKTCPGLDDTEEPEPCYEVVGIAYIQGWMHGEYLLQDGLVLCDFRLV